ncbi:MAG: zinc ribbon domain-containing protein [Candidatus Heimdallarchaeota archaeon]
MFPSTQRCCCGHHQKLQLVERVYRCPICQLTIDRDWNAALNLLLEGFGILQPPSRDPELIVEMPVETKTTTQRMVDYFDRLPYVRASLVAEAGSLTALARGSSLL